MLELLLGLGTDDCLRIADMTLKASPEMRARARKLMEGLPQSHVWLRGICAYAIAAGHVR